MIHKLYFGMNVHVHGAQMVAATIQRQCHGGLNRVPQTTSTLSVAHQQLAKEQMECNIHQMTLVKSKALQMLFQHHEQQTLQEVWTNTMSP